MRSVSRLHLSKGILRAGRDFKVAAWRGWDFCSCTVRAGEVRTGIFDFQVRALSKMRMVPEWYHWPRDPLLLPYRRMMVMMDIKDQRPCLVSGKPNRAWCSALFRGQEQPVWARQALYWSDERLLSLLYSWGISFPQGRVGIDQPCPLWTKVHRHLWEESSMHRLGSTEYPCHCWGKCLYLCPTGLSCPLFKMWISSTFYILPQAEGSVLGPV